MRKATMTISPALLALSLQTRVACRMTQENRDEEFDDSRADYTISKF